MKVEREKSLLSPETKFEVKTTWGVIQLWVTVNGNIEMLVDNHGNASLNQNMAHELANDLMAAVALLEERARPWNKTARDGGCVCHFNGEHVE